MAARAVARCACVTLARRLEGIDVYSNILYSRGEEGKAELSMLAQRAIAVDRYTPETCVVVGNYFSMMNKHEKAVQYFQRALVLNPEYLSAYTLMGHEFIETKNTSAALQAYRRSTPNFTTAIPSHIPCTGARWPSTTATTGRGASRASLAVFL